MTGVAIETLQAELVGRSSLALADAFDLGGVQGIDLRPTLAVILAADLAGQDEQRPEALFQGGVAVDLAVDVSDDAPEAGAQELECSASALELMGMAVSPDHDGGPLGDPQIALA